MSVGNVQNAMKRRQSSLPGMSWIVMTRRGGSQRIIAQFSWLMQSGHHCWFMDGLHAILHQHCLLMVQEEMSKAKVAEVSKAKVAEV